MKAVLISVQPKWCELIAIGKKTVEVRKTRPKIDTPFKCYIYQTKRSWIFRLFARLGLYQGRVVGEFICDEVYDITPIDSLPFGGALNYAFEFDFEGTCLSVEEFNNYLDGEDGYGWHVSDLKMYDIPKKLNDFRCPPFKKCKLKFDNKRCENGCVNNSLDCAYRKILHPPQSFYYVES